MKTIHTSYGIIPIYKQDGDFYVLCVQNHKGGHWGLPKGTPEGGETPFETAKRELKEETGISEFEILGGKTFFEKYSFEQDGVTHHKTNTYYIGIVSEMLDQQDGLDEIDQTKWVKIDECDTVLDFPGVIELSKEVHQYLQKFPMTNEYLGLSGETYLFEYFESDSLVHLPKDRLSQVAVMAFHNDKLLVVDNSTKPGTYGPVCGGIEKGEKPEDCLPRELKEESNMKVISFGLVGYQKCKNLSNPDKEDIYQIRYAAVVEPFGPFTPDCDPDGDVTELLEIDPSDYKKYFNWGEIGDCIMNRAIKFRDENKTIVHIRS